MKYGRDRERQFGEKVPEGTGRSDGVELKSAEMNGSSNGGILQG